MPLSINLFREEKNETSILLKSQEARFAKPEVVENIKQLDASWRKAEYELNQLNKQVNAISKEVGAKKKAKEDATDLISQVTSIKAEIKDKEKIIADLEHQINIKLRLVGNIVHSSVPISKNEDDNVVVKKWGTIDDTKTGKGYHHHELLYMIDGYSSERGVNVAGHRAYFLKGVGVLLNQALINYGLSFLMKKSYTALQPPYFMRKEVMADTAQLEEFDEALYKVTGGPDDPEMYLIATSEQPISAYHRGEWLAPEELPLRYAGNSTCFRKEAGSHGRDAWGIFRIHQFEKIEQFVLTAPDKSWEMHEELIRTCEEFYQSLGLSYHIINIVSGALNNAAAKKYDLEAWFPKLGVFRELVSASNCTDYQARAMETRYGHKKMGQTEKTYVHMLNATLCATERTICCILENYQTDKGVVVPEVLRPFMGGIDFMPFKFPPPKMTAGVEAAAKAQAEKDKAKAAAAGGAGAGAGAGEDKKE